MADNRIAYGLAKKHGIDTEGMSPKQVWDALNDKGIDWKKEYLSDREEEEHKREAYARKWTADVVPKDNSTVIDESDVIENSVLYKASKLWEKSLSDNEKVAIQGYTDATFQAINGYLRGNFTYSNFLASDIDWQVENMDKAIKKFYLPQRITTYRVANFIEFGDNIKSLSDLKKIRGNRVLLRGYSSTSISKNVVDEGFQGDVTIEYDIPEGLGIGAYLDHISLVQKEKEFLLKRNVYVIISDVKQEEGGQIVIKAEVV